MNRSRHVRRATLPAVAVSILLAVIGCSETRDSDGPIGTAEQRRALFEYLVDKTLQREAFSPEKNKRLNLDVEAAMRAFGDDVVNAGSEEEFFYALVRLSNARKDRHLSISGVEGGIATPRYYPGSGDAVPTAPVRLDLDYSIEDEIVLYVADIAVGENRPPEVRIGDRVLEINGVSPTERYEQARPYIRYSTELGFRRKFTEDVATRTGRLPPALYGEQLDLVLVGDDGKPYDVSLDYVDSSGIVWDGQSRVRYPGFRRVAERGTYDLYVSEQGVNAIVLDWHRFNKTLIDDMNWLMDYAADNQLLAHDIVFDATRSGGGSLGAYAIQRLSPKPFKTTFGNLRISDVIPAFIAGRVESFEANRVPRDGEGKETVDDGTWLIDWLTSDVQAAYDNGDAYSNNVPFKLAHAPKDSDGVIQPAPVHFTGEMVCMMGPNGGSHLDQFFAIVTDNRLCTTIGMQTGGYSNTWEWHEHVVFPGTDQVVVEFMWNIGHTISPNGKIVEGVPAEVDEYIPLTRENFLYYDDMLLERALEILAR